MKAIFAALALVLVSACEQEDPMTNVDTANVQDCAETNSCYYDDGTAK